MCCGGAEHGCGKLLKGVCAVQAQQHAAQAQQVAAEKAAQLHDAARAKGAELYTQVAPPRCFLCAHSGALWRRLGSCTCSSSGLAVPVGASVRLLPVFYIAMACFCKLTFNIDVVGESGM